ncbi:recombinase family protein [Kitasatospora sp. NPDC001132]
MTMERVTGMTYFAGGYTRQSQERANKSSASPAVQLGNILGHVEFRQTAGDDIKYVGTYAEKLGTSAFRSDKERPEFERMLNDCRKGTLNMILVDYVSRFSRLEIMDAIPIVTELLNIGVVIVSLAEGTFRKGNLMDLIHIIFRLDAAHNESKNKSRAVQGAHDLARSLGGFMGKAPYGFELEPVELPNPHDPRKVVVIQRLRHASDPLTSGPYGTQGDVLRAAARLFHDHMKRKFTPRRGESSPGSLTGICVGFREQGVPTRGQTVGRKTADSEWDPASLKRMLRDPLIAGFERDPIYDLDEAGKPVGRVQGYRIRRDPLTMRPILTACGPIVDPALWWAIQPGLEATGRGKGQSQGATPTLLSAMDRLYCECENVMAGHRKTANPAKSAYNCKRGNKVKPGQHAGSVTINMDGLDDHVARAIVARLQTAEDDPETGELLAEVARRWGLLHEAPEKAGERAELLAQRADAVMALEDLYADRKAGGYRGKIGQRAFLTAEAEATLQMEAAEERLAELDDSATPVLPLDEWLAHDLDADDEEYDPIGKGSWWAKADIADRREMVKLFIDRIVVKKSTVVGSAPGKVAIIGPRLEITWAQPPVEDDEEEATQAA